MTLTYLKKDFVVHGNTMAHEGQGHMPGSSNEALFITLKNQKQILDQSF